MQVGRPPSAPSLDGVLVIDKPRGPTSHDVVWRLRRALGVRAIGHAGTLDPMATGVLVAAVGEATKLVPWLTAHDKSYEATIALGVETDTLDAEGAEGQRVPPGVALCEALGSGDAEASPLVRSALDAERSRTLQMPPAYSAIRSGGERAFARARRGEHVELEPRPVVVHRLRVLASSAEPPWLQVAMDVGKGYYVRALARDLARALGTVGHLTALRRTRSGCFVAADAQALDAPAEALRAAVEPLARAAARALPTARLSEVGARDARHGRPVLATDLEGCPGALTPCAWLDAEGALVAVGQIEEGGLGRVLRGFGP
jgi:tRNA pseudouridine55 synthase